MKKIFITGMILAGFCMFMTSCNKEKDLYDPDYAKKAIVNEYSAKFTSFVGGYINPQQNWGFGPKTTSQAPSLTRGMAERYDLPPYDYTHTEKRYTKGFYDTVLSFLPEGQKAGGSAITNFEFLQRTNCYFDIFLVSTTQDSLEIGYYYYDPQKETALDHHDVPLIHSLGSEMRDSAFYQYTFYTSPSSDQWVTPEINYGYAIWTLSAEVQHVHCRIFSVPPVYVPTGSHIGFYVKNNSKSSGKYYNKKYYTDKNLNDADGPYFAVLDEKSAMLRNYYVVGMEDMNADNEDFDCNDVMFAIAKIEEGHPLLVTPQPIPQWVRIIGEDLNTHGGNSDFDFNDIVLDVLLTDDGADCILQAAGATLPIRINQDNNLEIHKMFQVERDVMVNTNAEQKGLKGATKEPVKFSLRGAFESIEDIVIEVDKGDKQNPLWVKFFADPGQPACKIAVDDPKFKWPDERVSIKDVYPLFPDWVANPSVKWY